MLKVLIGDGEPLVREELTILLEWEKLGFTICGQAENGIQALGMVDKLKCDLNKLTIEETREKIIEFSFECGKYIKNLKVNQPKGILLQVQNYINENFNQSLTLKGIADHFYVNSAYLGQIFKKNFGISFNDYLLQLRMEKAKDLLLRTDMKIYEIAENVGYKDVEYFIYNFEKLMAKTPLQYKKGQGKL